MRAISPTLAVSLLLALSVPALSRHADASKVNPIAGAQAGLSATQVDEANLKAQSRWLAAMPTSLKPFWDDMSEPTGPAVDVDKLDGLLAAQYPDVIERVLALYRWYGEGEGGWREYPAYESIPEKLLSRFEAKDLLRAMQFRQMTTGETEGAARFFACGDKQDLLRAMPPQMKEFLLEHVLSNGLPGKAGEDRRNLATAAFSD